MITLGMSSWNDDQAMPPSPPLPPAPNAANPISGAGRWRWGGDPVIIALLTGFGLRQPMG